MAIILNDDPLQKQQAAKQAALQSFNPGQVPAPPPVQPSTSQSPDYASSLVNYFGKPIPAVQPSAAPAPSPVTPAAPYQPRQSPGSFQNKYREYAQSPAGQAILNKPAAPPSPINGNPPAGGPSLPPVQTNQAPVPINGNPPAGGPSLSQPSSSKSNPWTLSSFLKNLGANAKAALPTASFQSPNKTK